MKIRTLAETKAHVARWQLRGKFKTLMTLADRTRTIDELAAHYDVTPEIVRGQIIGANKEIAFQNQKRIDLHMPTLGLLGVREPV